MAQATGILNRKQPVKAAHPIRVMLIDDSNVARAIFKRVLSEHENIAIVAEAADSGEALAMLATTPVDVVLLDIEMPMRSGLDALPDILSASCGARVIIVSSFIEENGPAAIEALSRGACDTLAKPGRAGFGGRFSEMLVEKVARLGASNIRSAAKQGSSAAPSAIQRPDCIAIGASTGGIPVIYKLIAALDPQLNCPVFIVQHLPEAFMDFFARQLSSHTNRLVSVAARGIEVAPGRIYVAPGDAHLVCRRSGTKVLIDHVAEYSESRYCPSVDALFASVAKCYGKGALAFVLSGMGNDGAAGARTLSAAGATIFLQDADSSVVWGMPGAVARDGTATAVMTPDEMAKLLSGASGA